MKAKATDIKHNKIFLEPVKGEYLIRDRKDAMCKILYETKDGADALQSAMWLAQTIIVEGTINIGRSNMMFNGERKD